MRLLFFRHGDPDYSIDNLTEKGKIEAKLLSDIIETFDIDEVYQSPLGRAKATAEYSLKVLGKEVTTLDWLKEFPALFDPNLSDTARMAYSNELRKDPISGKYEKRIVWDILPSYYGNHPELFDRYKWRESELVKCSNTLEVYDYIEKSFYEFLKSYGYEKDGDIFKAEKGNDKTLAFFCHFGITSVLLSMLWHVSPFMPMQFLAMAPTSVTEVVTEEREKGVVTFRTLRIGDISHLNIAGEKPSFSARYCEMYENEDERH
ncbi:MAG: histidine phosphatase family protein [Butyrivibrio sp.]|nr:histidine phosphatase family protein [Butyrivibrio sp.]